MTTPQTPPNPEILGRMNQMLTGYMVTQALYVVAKLGIADLVEAGPKEIATLANEAGADPQSLFRVMRALASVGVFIEVAPRTFGSTPLAAQLSDRARGSLRNLAIMFGEEMYRAWGNALDSVKSGGPAFPEVFGAGHFEFLETHADAAKTFNAAMATSFMPRVSVLLEHEWSGVEIVVDIGGGNGALLCALLDRHAHLRGVLLDRPHVAEEGRAQLTARGLIERCEVVGGDFFADVPENGDVYVLSRILHDWSDADCARILAVCRRAMKPNARLFIIDDVLPEGNEPHPGKWIDLQMMVVLGGRERTEADWRSLLSANGLTLSKVHSLGRSNMIEAITD